MWSKCPLQGITESLNEYLHQKRFKNFKRRVVMKKATVRGFAKLGLLAVMMIVAAGASAKAQTLDYRLTANIPFDFSVSDKKLPAGKYWISRAQQSQGDTIVQIRSTEGNANVIRLTIPVNTLYPAQSAAVVFHRYGNEY